MNAQRYGTGLALFCIFLLASLFTSAANNLAPRAAVDRTIVTEGDSLTLSIRIDDTGSYEAPDYSPLQKDFDVFGSSQSSQHVINNGRIESHTEWQATLMPKHSGQLQIPPLAVGGAQTQPITIQVNPASNSRAIDTSEPVFVEVQADRDNVYVQQQILLTARVYVAVQLDNMQLTKPEFDNATVRQLSETTFNRNINGMPYEVHELTYAIFPQQAGELIVPELVFNAVEVTGGRSLFDFPGRGRPVRKMSRQLSVHVKPIPKSFSGSVWLPARNLTLTETWSGDPHHLSVGDSITRNVAIRADGLLAEQLPKLDEAQIDAAKLYAEQPKLENKSDASGVHGKRIENTALIPTRSGALQLPESRVVWWDVDSDSEKVATLPSETFNIVLGNNTYTAPATPASQPAAAAPAMPAAANQPAPSIAIETASTKTLRWWQAATATLALLWLFTLYAYLQLRRKSPVFTAIDTHDMTRDIDEQHAWCDFTEACRANNPAVARQKLLRWATHFYCDKDVHSLEQLELVAGSAQLTRELHLLDNRLFGMRYDSNDWNGENLLQVAQAIRKGRSRDNAQMKTALPPLYPAA